MSCTCAISKYCIVHETVYMTSLIHHHTLSTHVCTRLTCGHQLQHTLHCTKKTTVENSYMDFPVSLSTSIYHTCKISTLCSEVQLQIYHNNTCTDMYDTYHSPCHVCWDLLFSQVTLSQCHDNHLHWHSGEQSSGPVMNGRVPTNINEHVLQS